MSFDITHVSSVDFCSDNSDTETCSISPPPSPPVEPIDAHAILIATAKSMGYLSDKKGSCNGIISMGMRAAILGKHARFNGRVDDITQLFNKHVRKHDPDNSLAKKPKELFNEENPIAKAVSKAIAKEIYSDPILFNDFAPFFDGIELLQQADLYPDYFEEGLVPTCPEDLRSLEALLSMITPEDSPSMQISEIARSSDVYLSDESFISYLKELKEIFDTSSIQTPIGIKLGTVTHRIAITYDPKTKKWLLIGSNPLPEYEVDKEEDVLNFVAARFKGHFFALTSHIHTLKKNSEPLKTNLEAYFKKKESGKVTYEKAIFSDRKGNTWLHLAAQMGYTSAVQPLITAGAQKNYPNNNGETPLEFAVHGKHEDIIKILVDANADINLENNKGETPLYIAVYNGFFNIVQELLKAKSSSKIPEKTYRFLIDFARKQNDWKIANALLLKCYQEKKSKPLKRSLIPIRVPKFFQVALPLN